MEDEGHLPGDRLSPGAALSRNAPVRQSLRKRIWNSLRPNRTSTGSRSLQDLNPDDKKHRRASPHGSEQALASRTSSDSSTQSSRPDGSPGHRRVLASDSKAASLDRVFMRSQVIQEHGKGDEEWRNSPPLKLARSKSVRERTNRMLRMVSRGVGHSKRHGVDSSQKDSDKNVRDGGASEQQQLSIDVLDAVHSPDLDTARVSASRSEGKLSTFRSPNAGNSSCKVELQTNGDGLPRSISPYQRKSILDTSGIGVAEGLSSQLQLRRSNLSQAASTAAPAVAGLISKKKWRSRPKLSGGQVNGEFFLWSPAKGDCEWQSLSGRYLTLVDADVSTLSEPERYILQKVALDELAQLNLNAHIAIPKEDGHLSSLKRGLSFRTKQKSTSDVLDGKGAAAPGCVFKMSLSQVIHNDTHMQKQLLSASTPLSEKSKSSTPSTGMDSEHSAVSSCESLDDLPSTMQSPEFHQYPPAPDHYAFMSMPGMAYSKPAASRTVSLPVRNGIAPTAGSAMSSLVSDPHILDGGGYTNSLPHRAYSVSGQSPVKHPLPSPMLVQSHGQVTPSSDVDTSADNSCVSMQARLHTPLAPVADSQGRSFSVDRLLVEALLLDMPTSSSSNTSKKGRDGKQEKFSLVDSLSPVPRRVPVLVTAAIDFLKQYGVNQEGLFRVPGNKTRCRQIQEEFDTGFEIQFSNNDHHVHDVASLLKKFFRDLPQPLLTRHLYTSFLSVTKFDSKERQLHALRLLCCLLPAVNRDTLRALLEFLYLVSQHAEDKLAEDGTEVLVTGNKMDISNLAIVIGPNILRPQKAKPHQVARQAKEQRFQGRLRHVMILLIKHHQLIFTVTKQLHHRVMLLLQVKQPSLVDYLLKKKCVDLGYDIPKDEFIKDLTGDRANKDAAASPRTALDESQTPTGTRTAVDDCDRVMVGGGSELALDSHFDVSEFLQKIPQWVASAESSTSLATNGRRAEVDREEAGDAVEKFESDESDGDDANNTFDRNGSAMVPDALLGSTKRRHPSTSSPRHVVPLKISVRRSSSARVHPRTAAEGQPLSESSGARVRRITSFGGRDRSKLQHALPSSPSDALVSPVPTVTAGTPVLLSPALSSGEVTPKLQTAQSREEVLVVQPPAYGQTPSNTTALPNGGRMTTSRSTSDMKSPVETSFASLASNSSGSVGSNSGDLSKTLRALGNADDSKFSVSAPYTPASTGTPRENSSSIQRRSSSPSLAKSGRLSNNKRVRTSENGRVYRLLCYFEALAEEKKVHEQREEEARLVRTSSITSPHMSRRTSQVSNGNVSAAASAAAKRISSADISSNWSNTSVSASSAPDSSCSAPSSVAQSRSTSFSTHSRGEPAQSQVSPVASSGSVMTTDSGCSACNSGSSIDSGNAESSSSATPPTVRITGKQTAQLELSLSSCGSGSGSGTSGRTTGSRQSNHRCLASESGVEVSVHGSCADMSTGRLPSDSQQQQQQQQQQQEQHMLSPMEAAHAELCGVRCHSRSSHRDLQVSAADVALGDEETDV